MYQLDTSVPALQEKIWRYLQEQLALAARRLVEALMEYERDCFLGCDAHQRTPARRGYRNGYQHRRLQSRFGLLRLRKPRVRGCEAPPSGPRCLSSTSAASLRWTRAFCSGSQEASRRGGQIYDELMTADQARARLRQWVDRWAQREPDAVRRFLYDFERTLTYLNAPLQWRSRLKTTNPLERFIKELNRNFHLISVFPSPVSLERITYLLWLNIKAQGYAPTVCKNPVPAFTRNS